MRPVLAFGALGLIAGCYPNSATPFPAGCGPFEETNIAALPAAIEGDPCPEVLVFEDTRFRETSSGRIVDAVHARTCIHAPIDVVWRAIRDPQTGRDPTTTQAFRVNAYEIDAMYDYSYQTHVTANTTFGITPEFDLEWRHCLVEGTDELPTLTGSRWRKVFGSEAITLLEGSIVALPLESDPTITEVQYQYHLDALTANHGTIRSYLTVIYGRLRDRAHDVPLVPDDCIGCPTPPPGY